MFNFNRIINKIRDSDKARETPPQSPQRTLSPEDGEDDQTAEGFLCPTCMQGFPSPEDLQSHYEDAHSEKNNAGHLCPICRMKMKTMKELQDHYAEYHVTNKNDDLATLKQEVAELHTTLREEKYHSDDLKREVQRLQVEVKSTKGDGDSKNEMEEVYKFQIRSLEETKALISSEVVLLRKQLAEAVEINILLKQEKERVEHKTSILDDDIAKLKGDLDSELSVKKTLEEVLQQAHEQISHLEAELQQRPAADDVAVLQQELIQVQTLMDKTSTEKEAEKAKLEKEFTKLQKEFSKMQNEAKRLKEQLDLAPNPEELNRLKLAMSEKSSGSQQLHASLQEEMEKNKKLGIKFEEIKTEVTRTEELLKNQTTLYSEAKSLLQDKDSEIKKLRDLINGKTEECAVLTEESNQKNETIKEVKGELADLQSKTDETRQTIQQKLDERERQVNQKILDLESTTSELSDSKSKLVGLTQQLNNLQTQFEEKTTKVDELEAKLWDKESQFDAELRQRKSIESKLNELEKELNGVRESKLRLETERTELFAKIEAGEGANTAIQQLEQETAKLQEKIQTQQKQTELQTEECSKKLENLHKQLQQTKNQLKTANDKCSKFEVAINDISSKLSTSQTKVQQLEADLKNKSEQLNSTESSGLSTKLALENEITNLKTGAEKIQQALSKTKDKNAKIEKELLSRAEANKALEAQLSKERDSGSHLKTEIARIENMLKDKQSEIKKLCLSKDELNGELAKMANQLHNLEKELKEKTARHEEQTQVLSERNIKLESQVMRMDSERNELLNTKNALEKQLAETDDELKCKCGELIAMQETVQNSKEKFEKLLEVNDVKWTTEIEAINARLRKLQDEHGNLRTDFRKKEEESQILRQNNEELKTGLAKSGKDITGIEKKLKEKEELIKNHLAKLNKVEEIAKEKSQLLKSQETEINTLKEENAKQKKEINDVKSSCEERVLKLQEIENLLKEKDIKLNEMEEEKNSMIKELQESVENENALSKSLEDLNRVKTMMGQQILKLDSDLKEVMEEQQKLKLQKTSLETEIFTKQKQISDLEEDKHNLEKNSRKLQEQFDDEVKRHEENANALVAAREILKTEKKEAEGHLELLEGKLSNERDRHEKVEVELQKSLDRVNYEKMEIKRKLDDLQLEHKALVQDMEQSDAKYEMQICALNENLSTLRGDLIAEQNKSHDIVKKMDVLTGDKLELEAKLENALDERRALLERCLSSESECERLRNECVDLRYKLDESQAAVHELGRENQTLQIESAKLTSRKWADDAQVTNCTLCQKLFSVTVRKHHCRNCGNIFCNECSTRQATVASSKHPVRVCDVCYADMSK